MRTESERTRGARRIGGLRGLFLLTCLAAVVGCGGGSGGSDAGSTLDAARESGVIRIGYANEAPYAYRDSASDRITGEAPEIARVILKDLGVAEVEGVLTEFGSLIPGLKAGRFDIIAAGMYIKPERCAQIAFSDPTYSIGEAFAVAKGNPKKLHSYEDVLKHADATIGVVQGTVERGYARDVGIPDDRVIVFPDAQSAWAGVGAGRVDCYAGTSLTVQDLLDKDSAGTVERASPFTDPVIDGASVRGYGAFGFRPGDSELVDAFNSGLKKFLGTPEHLELVRPFGFTEKESADGMTAASLCSGEGG